ncbi:hypothetical protein [Halorubrum sp. AJ67]|uniref:hypothetical protein n=1 Tax=Halorubrum sp. AJ67 TaxID=1173487 RepID=UPI0003DC7B96|nr:hypothetical protein [Halorubrum sp. AJ67]CDK38213.1 hypothetical protein BN903_413 [Halorubrum sp. AJ67]
MDATHRADADTPTPANRTLEIGYLPDEFGILLPDSSGFSVQKQTGMSCRKLQLDGQFLPLKRPQINRGFPDWFPQDDGALPPGDSHPVTKYDLETIPERDYRTLSDWVKARPLVAFHNFEEFSYWVDSVWFYGRNDLIEEVRKWNYDPSGHLLDRTMTETWDSLDDIWAAIEAELAFTFDEFDYFDHVTSSKSDTDLPLDPDVHQTPCEGVKWITLTGSKYYDDKPLCPWAEELKGETVMLLYPNCE